MFKKVAIFVFFILLLLPGIFMNCSDGVTIRENRALVGFPSLRSEDGKINSDFCGAFERWFRDHLGFREALLEVDSVFEYELLKTSATKHQIVGKDGWLYTKDSRSDEIGIGKYDIEDSQKKQIADRLCAFRDKLAAEGIELVFVMTPDKSSAYPEYFPGNFTTGITQIDRMEDYLKENTDLNVINLKDTLLAEKAVSKYPLYYKTDTHWNQAGAYTGYLEIMRRLNELGLTENKAVKGNLRQDDTAHEELYGDIVKLIRGYHERYTEIAPLLEYEENIPVTIAEGKETEWLEAYSKEKNITVQKFVNPEQDGPTVLLLGDSFCTLLKVNLSKSFGTLFYAWEYFPDDSLLEFTKPDIVIIECTERLFFRMLPDYVPGT